jgi:hypothetical protein
MPLDFETWIAGKKAAVRYGDDVAGVGRLVERLAAAEAQVAAVRRLCHLSDTLRVTDVLDALDGGGA